MLTMNILLFACACFSIISVSLSELAVLCYDKDCAPTYNITDIKASADKWDPFNINDTLALKFRKKASMDQCADNVKTNTGGWCLNKDKRRMVVLPNNQSYRLPTNHQEADDLILEQLDLLLKQSDGKYLSVIDFGAGVGQYGHALLAKSLNHRYMGYDGAGDIEKYSQGFLSFFDFTIPLSLNRADWMLCLEVGEHIPHEDEGQVIRNLHAHNKKGIILSWSVLGQSGHHHINNHSNDYIIKIFTELGYFHDEKMSNAFRTAAPGKTYKNYHSWFRKSTMVFRRIVELKD